MKIYNRFSPRFSSNFIDLDIRFYARLRKNYLPFEFIFIHGDTLIYNIYGLVAMTNFLDGRLFMFEGFIHLKKMHHFIEYMGG